MRFIFQYLIQISTFLSYRVALNSDDSSCHPNYDALFILFDSQNQEAQEDLIDKMIYANEDKSLEIEGLIHSIFGYKSYVSNDEFINKIVYKANWLLNPAKIR